MLLHQMNTSTKPRWSGWCLSRGGESPSWNEKSGIKTWISKSGRESLQTSLPAPGTRQNPGPSLQQQHRGRSPHALSPVSKKKGKLWEAQVAPGGRLYLRKHYLGDVGEWASGTLGKASSYGRLEFARISRSNSGDFHPIYSCSMSALWPKKHSRKPSINATA